MLALPAPTSNPPEPDRPAPPGMGWWAWFGPDGDWIEGRDPTGRPTFRRPIKQIGFVLGPAPAPAHPAPAIVSGG